MKHVAFSNHDHPHTPRAELEPEAEAEVLTEEWTGGIPPEEEEVDMEEEHMPTQKDNSKSHQTWDNLKNNRCTSNSKHTSNNNHLYHNLAGQQTPSSKRLSGTSQRETSWGWVYSPKT